MRNHPSVWTIVRRIRTIIVITSVIVSVKIRIIIIKSGICKPVNISVCPVEKIVVMISVMIRAIRKIVEKVIKTVSVNTV